MSKFSDFKTGSRVVINEEADTHAGEFGTVELVDSSDETAFVQVDGGGGHWYGVKELALHAAVGQSYEDVDGDCVTVLEVTQNLVGVSLFNNEQGDFGQWLTLPQLARKFTLVEENEELVELTLEEVAELRGVPVEKLRIKE